MTRREILIDCLKKAAVSYRKNYTAQQIEELATVAQDTLASIPAESIVEVFRWDYEHRSGMRGYPTDRDLLGAYKALREDARIKQDWNAQKQIFPETTIYEFSNLPWVYRSNRMRYLMDTENLTFEEQQELESYKARRWRIEDLVINETVAEMQSLAERMPLNELTAETKEAMKNI